MELNPTLTPMLVNIDEASTHIAKREGEMVGPLSVMLAEGGRRWGGEGGWRRFHCNKSMVFFHSRHVLKFENKANGVTNAFLTIIFAFSLAIQ
jgi:hypothetical protein